MARKMCGPCYARDPPPHQLALRRRGVQGGVATGVHRMALFSVRRGVRVVGFANSPEWADTGATTGFTYITSDWGDQVIYDPSVSASVSPTGTQYASSTSGTIGALLTATGTGGGGGSCPTGSGSGSGPIVTSVSPCTGSTSGGTSVTITGSNFTGVTGVKFGTTAASSYTVTSSTSITAVSPAGSSGPVDVTVTTGGMRLEELAAYSAYGVQTIQSGTDVTPFGFQGSYTDPSGLIYLINRYYDPVTDQFLSVDPDVKETGQPYAFTGDDPLNATDPLGLFCIFGHVSSKKNSGCRGSAEVKKVVKVAKEVKRVADVVGHAIKTHPKIAIGIALGVTSVVTGGASLALEPGLLTSLFHGKVSMRPEAPAGMVRRVGDMSTRPQPV